MTLLTTCPLSFPLPKPKWLPRFMRIDIWAVNILEPHLMSVSVRVNTFLAEDRCWSYLHWKCGALACSLLPLQHLCHLPPPPRCCLLPEGEWGAQAEQGLPGRRGAGRALRGLLGVDGPWLQQPHAGLPGLAAAGLSFCARGVFLCQTRARHPFLLCWAPSFSSFEKTRRPASGRRWILRDMF